jgi:hypothetical protein
LAQGLAGLFVGLQGVLLGLQGAGGPDGAVQAPGKGEHKDDGGGKRMHTFTLTSMGSVTGTFHRQGASPQAGRHPPQG